MRFVALMSGGIDSPVATDMMLGRGGEAIVLNMDNDPFSGSDESAKVEDLARLLSIRHPGKVRLFRALHGPVLSAVEEKGNPRYACLLCKKAMLLTADTLCDMTDSSVIVMGDSLGQVASQTLANIAAVSRGIKHPIVRPLIGMDKADIEIRAKDIGTFEISIRRTQGCTAAPDYPVTKAGSDNLEAEAARIDLKGVLRSVASRIAEIDLTNVK